MLITVTLDTLADHVTRYADKVEWSRGVLADAAATGETHRLADTLNTIAHEEGNLYALRLATAVYARQQSAEDVRAAMTDLLLQSPEDTFSGRTNDVRRARNDGVREAARAILFAARA